VLRAGLDRLGADQKNMTSYASTGGFIRAKYFFDIDPMMITILPIYRFTGWRGCSALKTIIFRLGRQIFSKGIAFRTPSKRRLLRHWAKIRLMLSTCLALPIYPSNVDSIETMPGPTIWLLRFSRRAASGPN
jgi:hypothetical protein